MGLPVFKVVAGEDCDLAQHYRERHGFTVFSLEAPRRDPLTPFMFGTCVGAAKRVLGLNAPWIVTPYQLFKELRRRHG